MISAVLLFISAISVSQACVPTTTTTTTVPCCPILSQVELPRLPPSSVSQQQCSILRRVSSTCGVDGLVVCEAAADTNPSQMQIEFFDGSNVVRTVTGAPSTLNARVVCVNGEWRVPTTTGSTTTLPISSVSCSQSGSIGKDAGHFYSGSH